MLNNSILVNWNLPKEDAMKNKFNMNEIKDPVFSHFFQNLSIFNVNVGAEDMVPQF